MLSLHFSTLSNAALDAWFTLRRKPDAEQTSFHPWSTRHLEKWNAHDVSCLHCKDWKRLEIRYTYIYIPSSEALSENTAARDSCSISACKVIPVHTCVHGFTVKLCILLMSWGVGGSLDLWLNRINGASTGGTVSPYLASHWVESRPKTASSSPACFCCFFISALVFALLCASHSRSTVDKISDAEYDWQHFVLGVDWTQGFPCFSCAHFLALVSLSH